MKMERRQTSYIAQMPIQVNKPQFKSQLKIIQNENKIIKKQNQLLRKQLDSVANKLDIQIKKKMDQKVKPWSRSVDSTYLQLQNAYKQCEIYKKEANFYKKKLQTLPNDQQKSTEIALCKDYLSNQNKLLKEQLKSLRKISKFQQKGLEEMGVQGFLKVAHENKKLSEQIKRLNKQLDEYRRGMNSVQNQNYQDQNQRQKSFKRMVNSSNAKIINTEPNESYERSNNFNSENSNCFDEMNQKMQKDYRKIKTLMGQMNKLREQLNQSKLQLSQKDKQIDALRSRIENLRKNNKIMQTQLGIKGTEEQKEENRSQNNKISKELPKHRVWSKNRTQSVNDARQPRKDERGRSPANTVKWNHQNFAGKIVQVQVLLHQYQGHILDLHVKYSRGEPKRLNIHKYPNKFQIFSCRPGQFIKNISGCFSDGYLQCLSLVTSQRRNKVFGNGFLLQSSDEQSQKFEFFIDSNQYPGSFYGQSDDKGISKLGCLIMKQ